MRLARSWRAVLTAVTRFLTAREPVIDGQVPLLDLRAAPQATILNPYGPYRREWWNCGRTNAAALWREIRARGYPGSYVGVRSYLARLRGNASCPPQPPAP